MSGQVPFRNALTGLMPNETPHDVLGEVLNALASSSSSPSTLSSNAQPQPYNALLASLAALSPQPTPAQTILGQAFERERRRQSWNDRFAHWERSESTTETDQIVRARDMVAEAMRDNPWLQGQNVQVIPQGSFTNRTNTRRDADIDLRVQHPLMRIECAQGVDVGSAWATGNYVNTGISLDDVAREMRTQIIIALATAFGWEGLDIGSKAIRVKGVNGSRAEVDVAPTFPLHYYWGTTILTGDLKYEGVALPTNDGSWIFNFPDRHRVNGRAKRLATGLQFKRVVRIVKWLRRDMLDQGVLQKKPQSFLVECLVYLVEDIHFLQQGDDRYDRVRRILGRILEILDSPTVWQAREINAIKLLFGTHQPWSLPEARDFIQRAANYLGSN